MRLVAGFPPQDRLVATEPLGFETFFEPEARALFRRLCAVTGNAAEAEEILQDAFPALCERWDRVASLQGPTGYLYRTAMSPHLIGTLHGGALRRPSSRGPRRT